MRMGLMRTTSFARMRLKACERVHLDKRPRQNRKFLRARACNVWRADGGEKRIRLQPYLHGPSGQSRGCIQIETGSAAKSNISNPLPGLGLNTIDMAWLVPNQEACMAE